MLVDIFIPCYIDNFFPHTAFNMIKVLEKAGCHVQYNTDQTCCGMPAYLEGHEDYCKEIGSKLITEFENDRPVVSLSPTCTGMIRNHYATLFHNSALHNEYKNLRKNILELSEFLVDRLNTTNLNATLNATAVYLDSCSSLREINVKLQPRQLLSQVNGLKLVELTDCETCCGEGGGFSANYPAFAELMASKKVDSIQATGASVVISNDYKCLMHLNKQLNERGIGIMHLADVLASGY